MKLVIIVNTENLKEYFKISCWFLIQKKGLGKRMIKKINNKLESINALLVNTIIFFIGMLLIVIAFLVNIPDWKNILLSIGCSLIASTVVTYLSSKYLVKLNRIKNLIDIWGLSAIYETRQEMNRSTGIAFDTLENNLDIIAWGFKSFRDAKDKIVIEKVKKGLKIRFIAPSPDSYYVRQREIDEREIEGQIKKTIIDLGQWIDSLKMIAPDSNNIQIKYYNSLPEDFYFRVDDYIYLGPYQWGKSSQQTISYEFKGISSKGFIYYNDYFEKLWSSQEFCKS